MVHESGKKKLTELKQVSQSFTGPEDETGLNKLLIDQATLSQNMDHDGSSLQGPAPPLDKLGPPKFPRFGGVKKTK